MMGRWALAGTSRGLSARVIPLGTGRCGFAIPGIDMAAGGVGCAVVRCLRW
jgi:hypothetical protein